MTLGVIILQHVSEALNSFTSVKSKTLHRIDANKPIDMIWSSVWIEKGSPPLDHKP